MIYGYARCSTDENRQDINRQIMELKKQGVCEDKIYLEYESGVSDKRVELNRLFERVKTGDVVIATEVSRITRSIKQLCEVIEVAKGKRLCLVFGTFKVDCSCEIDPMTEGMLKMMGVFAELERNIISQRVKSGIANARAKGKQIGRKKTTAETIPPIFYRYLPLYKEKDINKTEMARLCGVSYPTVCKYISLIEKL